MKKNNIDHYGINAKEALKSLSLSDNKQRNNALNETAKLLKTNVNQILEANKIDIENSQKKSMSNSFIDRLSLDKKRIYSIIDGLIDISKLEDPLNKVLSKWDRPNGLNISKISVPLGVIGIIYESRPNVTIDAGALCIKSGNTCILRGGSDSFHTSTLLTKFLQQGLKIAGLPETCVQIIDTTDRKMVTEILKASKYIDIIVPRGGKSLVAKIQKEAKVPVFAHLEGICHVYVDNEINLDKSIKIIINSKMRRTGICGAAETLLIDKNLEKESILKITVSYTHLTLPTT